MTTKTDELKRLIRQEYKKHDLMTLPNFNQLDDAIDECLAGGGIVNFKLNGRGMPEINLTYRETKHSGG